MEKEIAIFANQMQRQLDSNPNKENVWKTNVLTLESYLVDLEYHKAKMMLAIKEKNMGALKEYLADCGNILMFIGHKFDLFSEEDNKPIAYQMKSDIFIEVKIDEQNIKKLI